MITEEVYEHHVRRAEDYDFVGIPPTVPRQSDLRPSILLTVRRFLRRCSTKGGSRRRYEFYSGVVQGGRRLHLRSHPCSDEVLSAVSPLMAEFGVPEANRRRMAHEAARFWAKFGIGWGTLLILVNVVTVYKESEVVMPMAAGVAEVLLGEKDGGACAICLGEMEVGSDAAGLPYGHVYHDEFVRPWLKKTPSCPQCRFSLLPPSP